MAASRLDLAILREIVRIVQEKARVPEKVRILKRQYLLLYLEDHRQRMEEALRRFDMDRVNMLFGQLASKVKYQVIRESKRATPAPKRAAIKVKAVAKPATKPVVRAKPAPKPVPKPVLKKKTADKTPKRAAQVKRTSRPQLASRPKRATSPTSQRASGGRAAAARKPKPKKRAHR